MKARVHDLLEDRTIGICLTAVFGLVAYFFLGEGAAPWVAYGALATILWALSTLVTWRRERHVTSLRSLDRAVQVRVVRAEVGYSVLATAGWPRQSWMIEVESEAEARAICAAAGVPWPATSQVAVHVERPLLRTLRMELALIGAASAFLRLLHIAIQHDDIALFRTLSLGSTFLATVVLLLEPVFRKSVVGGKDRLAGSSALAQHFELHAAGGTAPSPVDRKVSTLERNLEPLDAWLDRLDALGRGGAYRADAFGRDELRTIAEDRGASVSARLGALRLLSRSEAVPTELRTRIADDLGMERVRVVVEEDAAAAAAELEEEEPAFVARR